MIVFIAGMPRSGSTFTFNIVRGLLEARGQVHHAPVESALAALEGAESADHLLFKGHATDDATLKLAKLGAMKVICSVRNPEDAIASCMETFDLPMEDAIAATQRWFGMFQAIKDYSLTLAFETINDDPFAAARSIASYIGAPPSEAEAICRLHTKDRVLEMSRRVANGEGNIKDVGFSSYDTTTLYHRRHVTSLHEKKAAARLTGAQIASIQDRMAPVIAGCALKA